MSINKAKITDPTQPNSINEKQSTRFDKHGNPIIKGKKLHTISFKEKDLIKVELVENWKKFNVLTPTSKYGCHCIIQ